MYSIKIETYTEEEKIKNLFTHYYEAEEFTFYKKTFYTSKELESSLMNLDNIYGGIVLSKPKEILQFPCKALNLVMFKNNNSYCKAVLAFCDKVYIMNYQGKTIDKIIVKPSS